MTDGDALLRAIIAQPDEDTPRLMYADWLDEQGEAQRAEFIRVQVALYGKAEPPRPKRPKECRRDFFGWKAYNKASRAYREDVAAYGHLRRRLNALWLHSAQNWWPVEPPFRASHYTINDYHFLHSTGPLALVARGFVEEVRCDFPAWERYGDALTAAHPVRSVIFTTWPTTDISDVVGPEDAAFSSWAFVAPFIVEKLRQRWPRPTFTLPGLSPYPSSRSIATDGSAPLAWQ